MAFQLHFEERSLYEKIIALAVPRLDVKVSTAELRTGDFIILKQNKVQGFPKVPDTFFEAHKIM